MRDVVTTEVVTREWTTFCSMEALGMPPLEQSYAAAMEAAGEHRDSPGNWTAEFLVAADGSVEEGLVVLSVSGAIEGRTTGARLRCLSTGCPGWFIGVSWETGQRLRPCSQGWAYDPLSKTVRITGGGEISARVVSPPRLGRPPAPSADWPTRSQLAHLKGWRASGTEAHHARRMDEWDTHWLDRHEVGEVLDALDRIGALATALRWTYRADRVSVAAVPYWLASWLRARAPESVGFETIEPRWNALAPESWCLGLRGVWSPSTTAERSVNRYDGWVHPDIAPAQWPELTRRVWHRETVTDVVRSMLTPDP